jgi:hypothetical protein
MNKHWDGNGRPRLVLTLELAVVLTPDTPSSAPDRNCTLLSPRCITETVWFFPRRPGLSSSREDCWASV